jgi:glutamate racemase
VIGVIDPGARAAVLKTTRFRVGVIGTPATVSSGAYSLAIRKYSNKVHVWETACPLFVPLVEEGWMQHEVTSHIANLYLAPLLKKKMDTLVLGCTHYPLLKKTLSQVVGPHVQLIDSAEETAKEVEQVLKKQGYLNSSKEKKKGDFFVTDNPGSFSRLGERFLGKNSLSAKRLPLEAL